MSVYISFVEEHHLKGMWIYCSHESSASPYKLPGVPVTGFLRSTPQEIPIEAQGTKPVLEKYDVLFHVG